MPRRVQGGANVAGGGSTQDTFDVSLGAEKYLNDLSARDRKFLISRLATEDDGDDKQQTIDKLTAFFEGKTAVTKNVNALLEEIEARNDGSGQQVLQSDLHSSQLAITNGAAASSQFDAPAHDVAQADDSAARIFLPAPNDQCRAAFADAIGRITDTTMHQWARQHMELIQGVFQKALAEVDSGQQFVQAQTMGSGDRQHALTRACRALIGTLYRINRDSPDHYNAFLRGEGAITIGGGFLTKNKTNDIDINAPYSFETTAQTLLGGQPGSPESTVAHAKSFQFSGSDIIRIRFSLSDYPLDLANGRDAREVHNQLNVLLEAAANDIPTTSPKNSGESRPGHKATNRIGEMAAALYAMLKPETLIRLLESRGQSQRVINQVTPTFAGIRNEIESICTQHKRYFFRQSEHHERNATDLATIQRALGQYDTLLRKLHL